MLYITAINHLKIAQKNLQKDGHYKDARLMKELIEAIERKVKKKSQKTQKST